jgi:hypothetical protein
VSDSHVHASRAWMARAPICDSEKQARCQRARAEVRRVNAYAPRRRNPSLPFLSSARYGRAPASGASASLSRGNRLALPAATQSGQRHAECRQGVSVQSRVTTGLATDRVARRLRRRGSCAARPRSLCGRRSR